MLIVLTAISTNYEKFMIRISQAEEDIQELWSDIIGKNINIVEGEEQSEKSLILVSPFKESEDKRRSSVRSEKMKMFSTLRNNTKSREGNNKRFNTSYLMSTNQNINEIKLLETKLQEKENVINMLNDNEIKLKERNTSLDTQLKEAFAKIFSYEKEITSLQNKLLECQTNHKEEIQQLHINIDNIKQEHQNQMEKLNQQLSQSHQNEIVNKEEFIRNLSIDEILNNNNAIKQYIESKDNNNNKYEPNKNDISIQKEDSELQTLRTTLLRALDEIEHDKNNYDEYIQIIEELQEQHDYRKQELEKREKDLLSKIQLLENKEKEISSKEYEFTFKQNAVIKHSESNSSIQINNNDKDKEISNLQSQLEKLKTKEESNNKAISLIQGEKKKLNMQVNKLQNENSRLLSKVGSLTKMISSSPGKNKKNCSSAKKKILSPGKKDIKGGNTNVENLFNKYFKVSNVSEQEIKNISDKILKSKLEIKNLNELIHRTQAENDELNEELMKVKKNLSRSEYEKVKLKQEITLLKKAMLEMNNKTAKEHEIVTNSLGQLANQFRNLKKKVS